jgi:MFS transporter, FHS family, L-fucose permease
MKQPSSSLIPMIILGILFFIFGFVTWLNGSLIPFLKVICDLNELEALLVTFAFYIAYTVMAFPMALLLERTGYKNGMALGLGIMALGALLFIPAAQTAHFAFFLIALFTLGTGLTILQTASNPYVVLIGPQESAAMRISIMGIINKAAGVVVPLIFTALILSNFEGFDLNALSASQKETLASRLIVPYVVMAAVLTGLIALVKFAPLPELKLESQESTAQSILHFPRVVLGAIAIFFYVGIEVIAGDTIGLYGQSLHVSHATALTSYTMVFMVLGYGMGVALIPRYLSQQQALLLTTLGGGVFLLGVVFGSQEHHMLSQLLWGWSGIATLPDSLTFVALLGFANALIWPSVWPLALEGLGRFTAQGSALLIMGIAGGALLPLAFGTLAQSFSMQNAYAIGLICYGYILFYALKGHKIKTW